MPKVQAVAESYSYASARAKINALELKGYRFVGSLPEEHAPWSMLKLAFFLFVKGSSYYQYSGRALLSDAAPRIETDGNNEPLPGSDFSKIINEDYIYVLLTPRTLGNEGSERLVVLLKRDAAVTGHSFLTGPYGAFSSRTIGGELYHLNGNLLLINRKSGSFHSEVEEAMPLIRAVWGGAGERAFHSAVEKEEVLLELQKRKALVAASQRSPHLAVFSAVPELPPPSSVALSDVRDALPGMVPAAGYKPVNNPPLVSIEPTKPFTNAHHVIFFPPEAPPVKEKPTTVCNRCIIL